MTKKEILEGGWIDKYVLGLTTDEESAEVERIALLYPEVQEQINTTRNIVCGSFNRNLTRPALRHSFLMKRRVLVGSAITVSLVLIGFAFLWFKHFSLKQDYASQQGQLAEEKAKVNKMALFSMLATERSRFLNSASTQRIKVKGCESTPEAEVVVFKCRLSGKMMLQVIDLPELLKGEHYEVWAHHDEQADRMLGQLLPPIKYDSLYVLDTAKHYISLLINKVDPVLNLSEPICLASVTK